MSGFLIIESADGGEAFNDLAEYLAGISDAAARRVAVRGLRAYAAKVRTEARKRAKYQIFKSSSGYRGRVRGSGTMASIHFRSGFYGNVLEAGTAAHVTPLNQKTPAGLHTWLQQHAPHMLQKPGMWIRGRFVPFAGNPRLLQWAKSHTGSDGLPLNVRRVLNLAAQAAQPWVIPAHDSIQGVALDAMREAVIDEMTKDDKA